MMDMFDEPGASFRARSNTWPLPRPENLPPDEDDGIGGNILDGYLANDGSLHLLTPFGLGDGPCTPGIPMRMPHSNSSSGSSPNASPPLHSLCSSNNTLTSNHGTLGSMGNLMSPSDGMPSPLDTLKMGMGSMSSSAAAAALKKNTSRRNAWGNMSYADLITQAIQGSPDQRLTLSQIYEWMVQNVSYFKDKGDSNSSAGWKDRELTSQSHQVDDDVLQVQICRVLPPVPTPVSQNSIRHNLSLHNRFMRVQNEGTGKSSWWMINPDAKPGKAARRRAASMETSKYEKRRGRVKKKVEAMKANIVAGTLIEPVATSPSSSISEGLDNFPDSPLNHIHYTMSPDFRPRASSNASSCSRLSPIPSTESDMHDNQVPPLSPMSGWGMSFVGDILPEPGSYGSEQLDHTMKALGSGYLGSNNKSPSNLSHLNSQYGTVYGPLAPQQYNGMCRPAIPDAPSYYPTNGMMESSLILTSLTPSTRSPPSRVPFDLIGLNNQVASSFTLSPNLSPAESMDMVTAITQSSAVPSSAYRSNPPSQQDHQPSEGSMSCQPKTNQPSSAGFSVRTITTLQRPPAMKSTSAMGHLMPFQNPLPNDLDFDVTPLQGGFLECDVNSVIQHELSVDGNLDFNFDQAAVAAAAAANSSGQQNGVTSSMSNSTSRGSWVH